MQQILTDLKAQHDELDTLLSGLDSDGWARPTRCPGWTVADVVLHLAQTDELALASIEDRLPEAAADWMVSPSGGSTVDDAAEAAVVGQRGTPPSVVLARWRTGTAAMLAAFAAGPPNARLTWVAGELSARTLATTRLAEGWIHTGDVADAVGVDLVPTDRLWHVARLAWRTLPYAYALSGAELDGPVAVILDAPGGGDRWSFGDGDAPTTVRGDALEFCLVAARRLSPTRTKLQAHGPDADRVLDLVRTYA